MRPAPLPGLAALFLYLVFLVGALVLIATVFPLSDWLTHPPLRLLAHLGLLACAIALLAVFRVPQACARLLMARAHVPPTFSRGLLFPVTCAVPVALFFFYFGDLGLGVAEPFLFLFLAACVIVLLDVFRVPQACARALMACARGLRTLPRVLLFLVMDAVLLTLALTTFAILWELASDLFEGHWPFLLVGLGVVAFTIALLTDFRVPQADVRALVTIARVLQAPSIARVLQAPMVWWWSHFSWRRLLVSCVCVSFVVGLLLLVAQHNAHQRQRMREQEEMEGRLKILAYEAQRDQVPVVRANVCLPANQPVPETAVRGELIDQRLAPRHAVLRWQDVADKFTATTILKDEILVRDRLLDSARSLESFLAQGERFQTLRLEARDAAAGFIGQGDRVDVVARTLGEDGWICRTVASDVGVFAVDSYVWEVPEGAHREGRPGASEYILKLTEAQACELLLLRRIDVHLTLALRHPAQQGPSTVYLAGPPVPPGPSPAKVKRVVPRAGPVGPVPTRSSGLTLEDRERVEKARRGPDAEPSEARPVSGKTRERALQETITENEAGFQD